MLKKKIIQKLTKIVGEENILTSPEDLTCYAYDAVNQKFCPEAVVFPGKAEEIGAILKLANQEQFAVIPRGAGSGFTGGSLAVLGGVILVTSRLNQIIEIDPDNLTAIVEPGVVCGEFQREVEKYGLYYPPDPASLAFSTLGGNVAECAGGPSALKYGVTRDYVTGLEVVLPTGEVITTGVRTRKGVVGYDLTRLIVGSEGTLAVITKVYLRLIPKPLSSITLMAFFKNIEDSAHTVSTIIRNKIVPAKLEFMDRGSIECVNTYQNLGFPEETETLLLIELDGDPVAIENEAEKVKKICLEQGSFRVERATDTREASNLWEVRRAISPSLLLLNLTKINEDVVVPRSKIPLLIHRMEDLKKSYQLTIISFGHAGDGNIHVNVMYDEKIPGEYEKAERAVHEIFQEVLNLGGTISGEHGIGITKAPFLTMELNESEIELMKKIKRVFDPNDILNPGKIFYG
ncbi:MAG TPA: FAD-linked oxidase C-terminal domain-containing protein [Thermodesulfobacteriota bacterium]|nr:FAD-linked oxidase C-terminal domain-containing protein [Thermodesulfobacteriota bacterium]